MIQHYRYILLQMSRLSEADAINLIPKARKALRPYASPAGFLDMRGGEEKNTEKASAVLCAKLI